MYTIQDILKQSATLINLIIGVAVGVAVLVFFWGLVKFIFKAGDEKSHEEGRNRMVWGLIAMFVLFSVWGLVHAIQSDFGIIPPDLKGFKGGSCYFDKLGYHCP